MSDRFPALKIPVGESMYGGVRYASGKIVERVRGRIVQRYLQWWTTNGVKKIYIGSVPYVGGDRHAPPAKLANGARRNGSSRRRRPQLDLADPS